MENVIDMFGIPILRSKHYDIMDDGIQYRVDEWLLDDMKQYTGKYTVVGFDGSLRIYEAEGELLFKGTLLDSFDFAEKVQQGITRKLKAL